MPLLLRLNAWSTSVNLSGDVMALRRAARALLGGSRGSERFRAFRFGPNRRRGSGSFIREPFALVQTAVGDRAFDRPVVLSFLWSPDFNHYPADHSWTNRHRPTSRCAGTAAVALVCGVLARLGFLQAYGERFKPISDRYVPYKVLGRGTYGVVCAAHDRVTGAAVAVKKVSSMSKTAIDGKHTLRELRLMRWLGRHPNIIGLLDAHASVEDDTVDLVMELLDTDMHRVIRSSQDLTDMVRSA